MRNAQEEEKAEETDKNLEVLEVETQNGQTAKCERVGPAKLPYQERKVIKRYWLWSSGIPHTPGLTADVVFER